MVWSMLDERISTMPSEPFTKELPLPKAWKQSIKSAVICTLSERKSKRTTAAVVLVKGQWGHRNPGLEIESIGRFDWRRRSGYHLQSHVENAFHRFNRIIEGQLRSKNSEAQEREALIGCTILNKMLEIGRPISYEVC